MPTLQEQARALGDPTRHAIFQYLTEASGAVDVAELTERFGLNHNAIRQHLAKLVASELVVEDQAPSTGRGRPRLNYRPHPGAWSRWGTAGPYERLSLLLSEMLRTGDSAEAVGRRAAHEGIRRPGRDVDPVVFVADAMAQQGFEPTVEHRRSGAEIVLHTCPFESTAVVDPDTVCAIHRGLAEGLAELTDDRVVVDEFLTRDPRRGSCRLRVHVSDDQ